MLPPKLLEQVQHLFLKSRYLANDVFSGEYETAFRGRGMEFEEVRDYIPGDDIRSIDWNVSARMDRPFVKVYREEREQTVMLLVDVSASTRFGSTGRPKREIMAEIGAVLAFAAVSSNDKVGLLTFSDRVETFVPPKKGRSHVWHVISQILSQKPQGEKTDIAAALHFLGKVVRRRSICFVISDYLDSEFEKAMQVAALRHDLVLLCVRDPLETAMPAGGLMVFRDLETGHARTVDLSAKKARDLFERKQRQALATQLNELRALGVDTLLLETQKDYIEPILRLFRLREKKS